MRWGKQQDRREKLVEISPCRKNKSLWTHSFKNLLSRKIGRFRACFHSFASADLRVGCDENMPRVRENRVGLATRPSAYPFDKDCSSWCCFETGPQRRAESRTQHESPRRRASSFFGDFVVSHGHRAWTSAKTRAIPSTSSSKVKNFSSRAMLSVEPAHDSIKTEIAPRPFGCPWTCALVLMHLRLIPKLWFDNDSQKNWIALARASSWQYPFSKRKTSIFAENGGYWVWKVWGSMLK